MNHWISEYLRAQKAAHESIPAAAVAEITDKLRAAMRENRQIFIFGNGGSAANASHFATDLGKGASDKLKKRFRVICLNDNVSWMTALANDYAYEDVFAGQLQNYANPGDLALGISVSGNSPNCVKAIVVGQGAWLAHRRSRWRQTRADGRTRRSGHRDCRHALWARRGCANDHSALALLRLHGKSRRC